VSGTQLNLLQVAAVVGKKLSLHFLMNQLTTQDSAGTYRPNPKRLLLGNSIQQEEITILFLCLCQKQTSVFFYLWGEIGTYFGSDCLLKVAVYMLQESAQDLLPQWLEMKTTKQHFASAHAQLRKSFVELFE